MSIHAAQFHTVTPFVWHLTQENQEGSRINDLCVCLCVCMCIQRLLLAALVSTAFHKPRYHQTDLDSSISRSDGYSQGWRLRNMIGQRREAIWLARRSKGLYSGTELLYGYVVSSCWDHWSLSNSQQTVLACMFGECVGHIVGTDSQNQRLANPGTQCT